MNKRSDLLKQTNPNQQITWLDQDLANAFIERGKSENVVITPQTAAQIASEIREKVKRNDELELKSITKEVTDKLFPNPAEKEIASSIDHILKIATDNINFVKIKMANYILGQMTEEEDTELRGDVIKDFVMPFQASTNPGIADLYRKYVAELIPVRQRIAELKAYLKDTDLIIKLEEDANANPDDKEKKKAFISERRKWITFGSEFISLNKKDAILSSGAELLNASDGYVSRSLAIADQYHGVDGMSRFLEKVWMPEIKNFKEIMNKVKMGIVLPEIAARARHAIEWILRHHHTTRYQEGSVSPHQDSISMEEFKKSPIYDEMKKQGNNDESISRAIDRINALPMTWRKGHAISMSLDPPAQKTVHQDIPTLLTNVPESWGEQIITNQPFNIEKGKEEEQKSRMEKGTKPQAMAKERKESEAANTKAHWSVLMNLTRNQRVDKSGKTRAEKYFDSLPEELKNEVLNSENTIESLKSDAPNVENGKDRNKKIEEHNESLPDRVKHVINSIDKMDDEDMLQDEDIMYIALKNPSIPDWVLMRSTLVGYPTKIRRLAKLRLKLRGWQLQLDEEGHPTKDETTNDFIWERIPGFERAASIISLAQGTDPNAAAQGIQNQVSSVDQQIQQLQAQMNQLTVQKQTLESQRDSVKTTQPQQPGANITPQTAPGTAPAPINGGVAPAMPMAADMISFRKIAQEDALFEEDISSYKDLKYRF